MKFIEAIGKFSQWKYLKVKPNTIFGYDGHLRHFCIFLRDPHIEEITLEQINEYLIWSQKMGFSPNTLEKYGLAIKEFIEFFGKQGYKVVNYELVPIPQKEYKMPRVASEEDFIKVISIIPDDSKAYYHIRNRAILWLLHDTGARIGELASLDISDVDLKKSLARVKTEKSRSRFPFRNIFWYNRQVGQALNSWLDKRKELLERTEIEEKEALFISVNGGVCKDGQVGRRMDIEAVGEMIRKYSRQAGLKYPLNAHSFRHRLGNELAKRGANNSVISEVLGHKQLESSRVYTRLFGRELQKVFVKLMRK